MEIFEDLAAEMDRLEEILAGLDEAAWLSPSAAAGWTVADVVLHLAQSEEAVLASVSGIDYGESMSRAGMIQPGASVDQIMAQLVESERAAPAQVFRRWRTARHAAVAALREADPARRLPWVAAPLKPATLATTRLAEHWAHGLDITTPLGIPFPDTARLRHVAWLAHGTLGYAFVAAGLEPAPVYCELVAPDGDDVWRFGPEDAPSAIRGSGGEFCRVAAQRMRAENSALEASGPHGADALRLLRTYAV